MLSLDMAYRIAIVGGTGTVGREELRNQTSAWAAGAEQARKAIQDFPGVELCDNPQQAEFPMPADYAAKEICAVGRLRIDSVMENRLSMWLVGD